jgi:glycosyltransferase involved in cell wall biosynthesis
MRIGIVAYWFNRGQAVVARQIRATLDGLGHETFVLARPTRKTNIRPGRIDTEGVWAQEGVTAASDYLIPAEEYLAWAGDVRPDVVMFDQNYQFDEIASLRSSGVRTVGRFVWEHFAAEHVEPALRAFDRIYSITACEQRRYADLGIETPRVRWGCFPELVEMADRGQRTEDSSAAPPAERGRTASGTSAGAQPRGRGRGLSDPEAGQQAGGSGRAAEHSPGVISARGGGRDLSGGGARQQAGGTGRAAEDSSGVIFLFPGGFMSKRKPLAETIEAFRATSDPRLRLVLKAQVERRSKQVARMIRGGSRLGRRDRRIELITADLPADEYMRMFAAADVCLAPSRWEGLGLHLFEATALGLPIITNDNPPMNEVVDDGVNGLLVPGIADGSAPRSGIPAFKPDVAALSVAIERLGDDGVRAELAAGARKRRAELGWDRTTEDLRALLVEVSG